MPTASLSVLATLPPGKSGVATPAAVLSEEDARVRDYVKFKKAQNIDRSTDAATRCARCNIRIDAGIGRRRCMQNKHQWPLYDALNPRIVME